MPRAAGAGGASRYAERPLEGGHDVDGWWSADSPSARRRPAERRPPSAASPRFTSGARSIIVKACYYPAMPRFSVFFCAALFLLTTYLVWSHFHDGESAEWGGSITEQRAR